MTNTQLLLERARKCCEPQTWYQLAKRTGIAEATISRVMNHGGTLDNANAFQLADFLGMNRAEVIIYIENDRPHPPKKKAFWERELPRVLPTVGFALAILGALTTHNGEAHAEGIQHSVVTPYTLCEVHKMTKAANQNPLGEHSFCPLRAIRTDLAGL